MTETMEVPSELAVILKRSSLSVDKATNLIEAFTPLIVEAAELTAAGGKVIVMDATQLTEMREASRIRKLLVKVRTGAVAAHWEVKADYLSGGRACDAAKNWLLGKIEPIEERMRGFEEFAERAEAARTMEHKAAREALLIPFGVDLAMYSQLGAMPEAAWKQLFDGVRLAHEARIAADAKIEADRLASIEQDRLERERIKAENERLAAENARIAEEARQLAISVEADRRAVEAARQAEAEQARKAAERARTDQWAAAEVARVERESAECKVKAERERAAEELRVANAAREAVERKAREEKEAADRRAKAEAAAAKKAAAAPDKEKILRLATAVRGTALPPCSTTDGQAVIVRVSAWLALLGNKIEEEGQKL